eukprot:1026635-Amphidinium_carterae.5
MGHIWVCKVTKLFKLLLRGFRARFRVLDTGGELPCGQDRDAVEANKRKYSTALQDFLMNEVEKEKQFQGNNSDAESEGRELVGASRVANMYYAQALDHLLHLVTESGVRI